MNELVSLQNQVKALREQDEIGKQNIHEDMKKNLNPLLKHLKIPLEM